MRGAVALALLAGIAAACARAAAPVDAPPAAAEVAAVYGIGTVTATHTFQLKLADAATLKTLHAQEGDWVAAQAPLVTLLDGRTFRAPFPGTVTALPFKPGENVFPQLPIVTVTDLQDRYVLVSLEQHGALRVRERQPVRLSFESLRAARFTGTVRAIYPHEGQFLVHITVAELPPAILPGMTADVAIEVDRSSTE